MSLLFYVGKRRGVLKPLRCKITQKILHMQDFNKFLLK